MRRAILHLTACFVISLSIAALAAAQNGDDGVWKPKSGAFSLNFGAAGWVNNSTKVDGSALVIAPSVDKNSAPVCALFGYPTSSIKSPVLQNAKSQADLNVFIDLRAKSPGYTQVHTTGGISVAQTMISNPKDGNFRDFWFAAWEAGQGFVYNLSCGAPSASLLNAPNMDALAKAIALP